MTEDEVATVLGLSRTEVRRLCRAGRLPHWRPGGARGRTVVFVRERIEERRDEILATHARMLEAAQRGARSLLLDNVTTRPIDSRDARVRESDAFAIDDIDEESVSTMISRFKCTPRFVPDRQHRQARGEFPRYVHPGWIYALSCPLTGLTKIGRTEDAHPWRRISGIVTMNAAPLRLLGLAHGAGFELELHAIFASARRHGEWFALSENPLPNTKHCALCRWSGGAWDPYDRAATVQ